MPIPEPKKIEPKSNHYENRRIQNQPKSIKVKMSGMDTGRSLQLGSTAGLNYKYKLSTYTETPVTDKNDIAFFIKKAILNHEYYDIVEPKDLIEKYRQKELEKNQPKKSIKDKIVDKLSGN